MSTDVKPARRKTRGGDGHRRSGKPQRRSARVFPYVVLFAYSATAVFGAGWMLNASLKTNQSFTLDSPWSIVTEPQWQNYIDAWTVAGIGKFLVNSVFVSVAATLLGLAVSVLAVYPLTRIKFRLSQATMLFFLAGLTVPWVVTFIPLFFLLRTLGLLDSLTGLIIVYATFNIPFNLFVLSGFASSIPMELEYSAEVDGASPWQVYWYIFLPLSVPGVISVGIIAFLQNWNEFFFALVFLTSSDKATLPLGLTRLAVSAEYASNWVVLFAGLMLAALPVLLVFGIMQKRIVAGLAEGALKN